MSPQTVAPLWPLAVYFVLVVLLAGALVGIPYLLGERHRQRATGEVYESGLRPTGGARRPLAANYFLLAMFFVIFDLEAVFLYAWAVAARQLGWLALGQAAIFVAVLLAALGYLWGVGALDWGPTAARRDGPAGEGKYEPTP